MRASATWLCAAAAVALGLATSASCSSSNPRDDVARQAIAYGAPDTAHSAVVALLASTPDGFGACSGTIVQVLGDFGYVLTAAHCCNEATPSVVVMGEDYADGLAYLGGIPQPPAYSVASGTVYYDPLYTGTDHDFCMLKFSGATGAPTIALPSGSDGLTVGTSAEHVGYGVTDTSTDNTTRRTGTSQVEALDALEIQWAQGGVSDTPGTCQGDSGGPALTPAGAAQGSQKVVGITSYGDSSTCAQATVGVASRVTSELGTNGFITKFLADAPIGTKAAAIPSATCSSCTSTASGTSCATAADACINNTKCSALIDCQNGCTTLACVTACETTAGTSAVTLLNAFYQCVCESPACMNLCQCPTTDPPPDLRRPRDLTDPSATAEDLAEPPIEEGADMAVTTGRKKSGGCQASGAGSGGDLAALLLAGGALLRRRRRAGG